LCCSVWEPRSSSGELSVFTFFSPLSNSPHQRPSFSIIPPFAEPSTPHWYFVLLFGTPSVFLEVFTEDFSRYFGREALFCRSLLSLFPLSFPQLQSVFRRLYFAILFLHGPERLLEALSCRLYFFLTLPLSGRLLD